MRFLFNVGDALSYELALPFKLDVFENMIY